MFEILSLWVDVSLSLDMLTTWIEYKISPSRYAESFYLKV